MRIPVKPIAFVVALLMPLAVRAQSPVSAPHSEPVVADSTPVGPTIASSTVAFRPVVAIDSLALDPQRSARHKGMGQPQAMMIVGGAAIVVGVLVGDTPGNVIALSGAVIGLYGLYLYLK